VGVILIVLFGLLAAFRMPLQLAPDVSRPMISISTSWPGASPQEIEEEIVNEQEEQLKGVVGVTRMTSESRDSSGSITLEFAVGTNMQEALLLVNSALQKVREYPLTADKPVINTSSNTDRSVAWFILSDLPPTLEQLDEFAATRPELTDEVEHVKRAYATSMGLAAFRLREFVARHPEAAPLLPSKTDVTQLRKFAEDVLEAEFERVPGVSNSDVRGGQEEELQVHLDANKLAARGLTIGNVADVLRQQNRNTSAGDFWEGKRRWVVRMLGQYSSTDEIANQIITTSDDGTPVYIRDVATVKLGYKKPDGFVRRYGVSNISLNVQSEAGSNVFDVMAGLQTAMKRLNEDVLAQRGLVLSQVYDDTVYIDSAIGLVNQNIVLGSALTVIILMLFLHIGARTLVCIPILAGFTVAALLISPWFFVGTLLTILVTGLWFARGTLVVAVAIPVSIIGTFLILNWLGRSLNVISLAGLAFAVGMLVDNAVVVLENIFRFYQMGHSVRESARRGTAEVWGAVLASTLTTLFVFLPIVFLPGEAGQLFVDIALAISAAVGLSLVVSVIVIPTAAARILSQRGGRHEVEQTGLSRWITGMGNRFTQIVTNLNGWIQLSVLRRIAVVLGLFAVALGVSWWLMPQIEYLPSGNRNLIIGRVMLPSGYNVQHIGEIGARVEQKLRPWWDIDAESIKSLPDDQPAIADFFYVARGTMVFIGLRAQDPMKARGLVKLLQEQLRDVAPGAIVIASQTSIFGRGLGGGREIEIEIVGPELTRLVEIGGQIMGQIKDEFGPDTQARPVPSLDLSSPEVHVTARPAQANQLGMNNSDIGATLNALVDGAYVGDYSVGGQKIDLVVLGSDSWESQTQDLEKQYVATPVETKPVRLDSFVEVKLGAGPEQVNHSERARSIAIELTPPDALSLEKAIEIVQDQIVGSLRARGMLEGGYQIRLSGTADRLAETWKELRWNFLLAILITYLLMAALFESFVYPLVIIVSVPMGAVGGILGLRMLGFYLAAKGEPPQNLDVLTMLGFIILVGTVVNNAILIVHQALIHMRSDGMSSRDAVTESVRTRIRPIFMTTLTTVFGLSPLVFFPGAGSELYRGLGSVVLGGLVVATVVTLLLIPTMFTLMVDAGAWIRSLFVSESGDTGDGGPALPTSNPALERRHTPDDATPVAVDV
jgi:HAE1 family hydrophobic/amphiphilic exporter-1